MTEAFRQRWDQLWVVPVDSRGDEGGGEGERERRKGRQNKYKWKGQNICAYLIRDPTHRRRAQSHSATPSWVAYNDTATPLASLLISLWTPEYPTLRIPAMGPNTSTTTTLDRLETGEQIEQISFRVT